jgi:hypothetical protein
VSKAGVAPPASGMSVIDADLMFLASWVGDSLLVRTIPEGKEKVRAAIRDARATSRAHGWEIHICTHAQAQAPTHPHTHSQVDMHARTHLHTHIHTHRDRDRERERETVRVFYTFRNAPLLKLKLILNTLDGHDTMETPHATFPLMMFGLLTRVLL